MRKREIDKNSPLGAQAEEAQKAHRAADARPISPGASDARKARDAIQRDPTRLKQGASEAARVEKALNPPPARDRQQPRRTEKDPRLERAGAPADPGHLDQENGRIKTALSADSSQ